MLRSLILIAALAVLSALTSAFAADAQIQSPLKRTVFQDNEQIYLTVVRSSADALKAGTLTLNATADHGSKLSFTFPVKAAAVASYPAPAPAPGAPKPAAPLPEVKEARSVEHILLNGWLIRPGKYHVEVAVDGATAASDIEVCSHIRLTDFKLIDWGNRATALNNEQAALGAYAAGFNLSFCAYGGIDVPALMRGGLDYMRCCTMGGAHQMDLRMECDWSDPRVLQGGAARVDAQALKDRVSGNAIGVHFYDEPGLTWWKHTTTNEMTPHNIPAQDRSFKFAYGQTPLQYNEVKKDDQASLDKWYDWGRWKLSFMDAAWKYSADGVSRIKSDFISCTQSVYGWNAYGDGYYWPITRSLPVISGHGGYDDLGYGYLFPSFTFEFGRMRELSKPNWYLPAWYGNTPSNRFRVEQYLSFAANLQGMAKPPDMTVHRPLTCLDSEGIIESNKVMARLGTIYTHIPVTRPETAILYSISQCLFAQGLDMKENYNGGRHRSAMQSMYMVSKMNQYPLFPIVEEDVLDGTLSANHKAVVLAGIDFLDPKVVVALEGYAAGGGTVLLTDDCKVAIKGGKKIGLPVDVSVDEQSAKAWNDKNMDLVHELGTAGNYFKSAEPMAQKLKEVLGGLGIAPVMVSDSSYVAATRQAKGDIEYLFAVNIAPDIQRSGKNDLRPLTANISLPNDGRPVYDAVMGGAVAEFKGADKNLTGTFNFGPGAMRVFARTARPIGAIQAGTPTIVKDLTLAKDPIKLNVSAVLVDDKNRILCGSAPLSIRVTDALGAVRYDLFRATADGMLRLDLPLAANDANGLWKVTIRELLSNKEDTVSFNYTTAGNCAAVAGSTPRATFFGEDRDQIFRFFRTHRSVTLVTGSSPFDSAAAERITQALAEWEVTCKVVSAAEVAHPRKLTPEQAKSWIGMQGGTRKPEDAHVKNTGFDVQGAVVLIGTPEDNPLIAFANEQNLLPYVADINFPGPGRGYLAWQRDVVGYGQDSVTVIAYDEKGMSEAVGTLYETAAGLNPMFTLTPPATNTVTPASTMQIKPEMKLAWQTVLPDRAASMKVLADGRAVVLSQDGSLQMLDGSGKSAWQVRVPGSGGEDWKLDVSPDGKLIAIGASHHAVGIDGNSGQTLFDVPFRFKEPGKSGTPVCAVAFVAALPDGSGAVAGSNTGRVLLIDTKGATRWTLGGVTEESYAKYLADLKEWDAGAPQRATELDAFKKAQEAFKVANAEWEKDKKKSEKPVPPVALKQAPKPQAPKPVVYTQGAFTNDGKSLLALSDTEAHLIDATTGEVKSKEGGASGKVAPVRSGDNFIITNSSGRVALYSPADGKSLKQMTIQVPYFDHNNGKPKPPVGSGIAAMAPAEDGGLLIGSENESTIRFLKAPEGDVKAQTTWKLEDTRRLIKRISVKGNLAVLGYWGGHLQIIDTANGDIKAEQDLPQDIAALNWQNDRVLIALADGRVQAYDVK